MNDDPIIYAAVHLVSQSTDHFHMLVQGVDIDELIAAVVGESHEEMEYIEDIYVQCSDRAFDDPLYDALKALRDSDDSEHTY